jgi:hypothetical protein
MTLLRHASWSCLRRKMSRHYMTRQHTTKTRQAKSDGKNKQTKLDIQYKQTTRCVGIVCVRVMLSIVHSPCCGENTSAHMGQFRVQIHVFQAKGCTNENYTTWPHVTKNNTKIGLSSDNIKQHNVGKSRVQSGVLCDSFNITPPTSLPLHTA